MVKTILNRGNIVLTSLKRLLSAIKPLRGKAPQEALSISHFTGEIDDPVLRVENLVKYFKEIPAVRGISFSVRKGEIVGLLGPNGSGKTTILRSICGILSSDEGRIVAAGRDLEHDAEDARQVMGFVPEVPHLFELLTVRDHLVFIALAFGMEEGIDERIEVLLKFFELEEKSDELVSTLSKGMRQKLAMACALIHHPLLLVLDEPIIGIDPRGVWKMKELLKQLRDSGVAIVLSTHLLDTAELLCDRVIIVNRGEKVMEGTVEEIRQSGQPGAGSSLEEIFLQLTGGESR